MLVMKSINVSAIQYVNLSKLLCYVKQEYGKKIITFNLLTKTAPLGSEQWPSENKLCQQYIPVVSNVSAEDSLQSNSKTDTVHIPLLIEFNINRLIS